MPVLPSRCARGDPPEGAARPSPGRGGFAGALKVVSSGELEAAEDLWGVGPGWGCGKAGAQAGEERRHVGGEQAWEPRCA